MAEVLPDGTYVYNTAGENLGHISDVILEKRSGKATYAVMSFGGFLGIGEEQHPIPWDRLDYDENRGGYVVDIPKATLESAPRHERGRNDWTSDRAYEERLHRHYGATPYW